MTRMIFINILLIYSWLSITTALIDDSRTIDGDQSIRVIGQRPQCNTKKDYDFITEYKRLPHQHRYVTEYKRFPEYRYSFGIGKRWLDDNNIKRALPYSFGIGKRSQMEKFRPMKFNNDYLINNNDNYFNNNDAIIDDLQNKRNIQLRPYDFGIGKRNKILDELQGLQHSIDYNSEINQRPIKQNNFDTTNKIFNGAEQLLEQY